MNSTIKSAKAQGKSVSAAEQLKEIRFKSLISFDQKLREVGEYPLRTKALEIFQMNLGKMCNQVCEHCHVDAGPDRKEIMTKEVMKLCLSAIDKSPAVKSVDLTGGAPEMNPNFEWLIGELSKRKLEIIVRSNLTILVSNAKYKSYFEFFKKHRIHVIASLPCYTKENVDKQRGDGVFDRSIEAIRKLNSVGYGKENSGLLLDFVYNPGGTGIPGDQLRLEKDYKRILNDQHNIEFNHLYTITNMPISRFLDYLLALGKTETYMENLVMAFNPAATFGLMCKNTLSVSYDGLLHDCDFNQMLEIPVDGKSKHLSEWNDFQQQERKIVTDAHCYGCTAGAGSSCQGALV